MIPIKIGTICIENRPGEGLFFLMKKGGSRLGFLSEKGGEIV